MIWNPWRVVREQRAEIDSLSNEVGWLHQRCDLLADRYDKVRDMNLQLRDALDLYRRAD